MRIVVVLPDPFGPRKPHTSPSGTAMSMPLTALLCRSVLVKPLHVDGEANDRSQRAHVHRLAGIELQAAGRARLQLEDELFATADGEDHGRREFLLLRNESDGCDDAGRAAVAADLHACSPRCILGELALRHEEAHIDILRRQDRDDRRHGGRIFPGAEIDVLHAAGGACDDVPFGKLIDAR